MGSEHDKFYETSFALLKDQATKGQYKWDLITNNTNKKDDESLSQKRRRVDARYWFSRHIVHLYLRNQQSAPKNGKVNPKVLKDLHTNLRRRICQGRANTVSQSKRGHGGCANKHVVVKTQIKLRSTLVESQIPGCLIGFLRDVPTEEEDRRKFESDHGLQTSMWGPIFWECIHFVAVACDARELNLDLGLKWILAVRYLLPCGPCRKQADGNYRAAVRELDRSGITNDNLSLSVAIQRLLAQGVSLFDFTFSLHNEVNKMLLKKILPQSMKKKRQRQIQKRCFTSKFLCVDCHSQSIPK